MATMDPTVKAIAALKRELPKIIGSVPPEDREMVLGVAASEVNKLRAAELDKIKKGEDFPMGARVGDVGGQHAVDESREFGSLHP